ncbi:hypothetical protein [Myroides sp. DW712]|uniref:hypothetical protein n=1 Tax=Myroides sp. DW712 TaxID=3389800 RepID=UPI00397880FC
MYLSLITGVSYAGVHCLFQLADGEAIQPVRLLFQTTFFAVFWWFIFFKLQIKKKKLAFEGGDNQSVAFYGVAHQLIKTSTVVGVLYATDKQLCFEPDTKAFVSSTWAVDWRNIKKIQYYSFLGLYNRGLLIQTQGGMTFTFVVNQPHVWLEAIQARIES